MFKSLDDFVFNTLLFHYLNVAAVICIFNFYKFSACKFN